MDLSNSAAWLTGSKVKPLEVKSAPYTHPSANQIVIKNGAVAVNPVDWMIQEQGTSVMYNWLKYPFVLGTDVAGEVVEVGPDVTRFKVGDRVIGEAVGQDQKRNTAAEGAFQKYTVLLTHMTSPIPDNMSYENACVMPLGVATAACGLFEKDQLALQLPSGQSSVVFTGETVLIWGGSTSVGSNAIQLAVAAGYEVFTTASPKNFDYVKKLGAARVFDYNSKTVISDIIKAFEGKRSAGALSIGAGAADACMEIVDKTKGNKFISMATYPSLSTPSSRFPVATTILNFMYWSVTTFIRTKLRGIRWKFIFATTLVENGVGKAIFEDFLPQALAESKFLAVPEPIIVGKGLEHIQAAMDVQKKGVSAKKVVVSL